MVQQISKAKLGAALKSMGMTVSEAWANAVQLDDEEASRLDELADQCDGLPRLREIDGLLLLKTDDDIVAYHDTRAAHRELIGNILRSTVAIPNDEEHDPEDVYDDGFYPDVEPEYESRA